MSDRDFEFIRNEFFEYVKVNRILEKKDKEIRDIWDKHELEAMKLIYCTDKTFDDKDAIKTLVDKQHKINMNMMKDRTAWRLGYCLLTEKPN